ncbi:MAG: hypothetical protein R3B13_23320 [Polyangiaceae bacterium]
MFPLAGAHLACGPRGPTTAPKAERFPPYGAAEAALFGDSMAPDFLGGERREPPETDQYLAMRVAWAESVLVGRISTVDQDARDSGGPHFTLTVTATAPALAGETPDGPVQLLVPPSSSSYTWVRSLDVALVGRPLILFMKRYNDAGLARIHWHLEPDTPAVRMAVDRARRMRKANK